MDSERRIPKALSDVWAWREEAARQREQMTPEQYRAYADELAKKFGLKTVPESELVRPQHPHAENRSEQHKKAG